MQVVSLIVTKVPLYVNCAELELGLCYQLTGKNRKNSFTGLPVKTFLLINWNLTDVANMRLNTIRYYSFCLVLPSYHAANDIIKLIERQK